MSEDRIRRMIREAMERAGSHKLNIKIVPSTDVNQPDPEIVMDPMYEIIPVRKIRWEDENGVIHGPA